MSGLQDAVALTPQQCPYRVGQQVELISPQGRREPARVLSIHRPEAGGVEIVVRTVDLADAPGRNVNVFTTSGRSHCLIPAGSKPCPHAESMWGRCVACGMTWEQQAAEEAL
jgi:hypothetical protein